MIRPFFLALQFLTRLPSPNYRNISDKEIAMSQYFYPMIGLIIGLILFLSSTLLTLSSNNLEAALLLSLWVLITGALHLDGLADCADAWVGGHGNKEKTLSIMKDPQSGPIAVAVIVCILLIKFTAIEALITSGTYYALIICPLIARGLLPLLFHVTTYVRLNGLGSPLSSYKSVPLLILSLLFTLMITIYLMKAEFYIVLLPALFIFWLIRHLSIKRIEGITGDVAGATIELTEVTVLVGVLIFYQY